ncbi:MAG: hypothetical protein ACE5IR_24560 [bacterium]
MKTQQLEKLLRERYHIPSDRTGPMLLELNWQKGQIDWSKLKLINAQDYLNFREFADREKMRT